MTIENALLVEAEYWNDHHPEVKIKCSPIFYSGPWDVAVLPVENFILLKNTRRHTYEGLWLPYGPGYMLKNAWVRHVLDYLKEPWTFEEMLLRATRQHPHTMSWVWNGEVFTLNAEVLVCNQRTVFLSPAEKVLLEALIQRHGRPVTRELLGKELWGENIKEDSRFLDLSISTLRKKIRGLSSQAKSNPIQAVRGCGYLLP